MKLAIAFVGAMAAASVLAGCAGNFDGGPGGAAGARDQQAAWPRGSCIGVLSTIGHSFTVKTIGLMVFGNEEKQVAIDSWGIDNLVVNRIRAHIGSQVTTERIAYPKEALNSQGRRGLFAEYEGPLKTHLQALAPSERCARYVVVARRDTDYTGTNQTIGGLGIVRHTSFITHATFPLYSIFTLTVFDGTNWTRLRSLPAVAADQGPYMGVVRGPHVGIETAGWPDPAESAARSARLRQATSELVSQTLDRTLPYLRALESAGSM